jgi:hypothetical protein
VAGKKKTVSEKIASAVDSVLHPHAHEEENATVESEDETSEEESKEENEQAKGPDAKSSHSDSAIVETSKLDKFK